MQDAAHTGFATSDLAQFDLTQTNPVDRIWSDPESFLAQTRPDDPVLIFCPEILTAQTRIFIDGFPGLVSYAVKANPAPAVLKTILDAGLATFDVASPDEIAIMRDLSPESALHYHNPAKSHREIAFALLRGVRTFSLDSFNELDKIDTGSVDIGVPRNAIEISVRFRLPSVSGASYNFGAKFGADIDHAATILARASQLGFRPSLTFHPGTQCESPEAWRSYIEAAERIATMAGVQISRLNVGGGFPANLYGAEHPLSPFFEEISKAAEPLSSAGVALVCEPGRALVAGSMALATRVKLVRDDGSVFLNDGVYGALDEQPVLNRLRQFRVFNSNGRPRTGATKGRALFGPTCDSVDRMPGAPEMPDDIAEDDYVVFYGMGAYGSATATRFNGYGNLDAVVAASLGQPILTQQIPGQHIPG